MGLYLLAMKKSSVKQRGAARVLVPQRDQVRMLTASLDELLDAEHRVRLVWQYAESLDPTELDEAIRVTPHTTGRSAIDPRLLFALWLFATIEGVGSARQLAKPTERDLPYRWLCGEVSVNDHRLSDFRTDHGDLLERLMVDSIGVLLHQELITLQTVAQDGMRVRASAGASRFLGEEGLERALQQARDHVERVRDEQEEAPSGDEPRRRAARKRAAEDRLQRIAAARENLQQIQQQHEERRDQKKTTPKASTTDPEARRMRMGDQGFRPAYNVQFVTDGDSRLIVGVEVTNQGSDCGTSESKDGLRSDGPAARAAVRAVRRDACELSGGRPVRHDRRRDTGGETRLASARTAQP